MINDKCPGFTLLEILVVVTIMGLLATLMVSVFSDEAGQRYTGQTLQTMKEIKKAILGIKSGSVRGDLRFAGYVEDMGELPNLYLEDRRVPEGGQPKGLWTRDLKNTPGETDDDLFLYRDYTIGTTPSGLRPFLSISVGWHGPYLKRPAGDILRDGWGNPLLFVRFDIDEDGNRKISAGGKNLTIVSYGSDGKKGGEGHQRDIVFSIRKDEYLATVAGYISPFTAVKDSFELELRSGSWYHYEPSPDNPDLNVEVRAYFRPENNIQEILDMGYINTIIKPEDGYFRLDDVPIGAERLLLVTQLVSYVKTSSGKKYDYHLSFPCKLHVQQGINWLGKMSSFPY